jgi:hypothetical protein
MRRPVPRGTGRTRQMVRPGLAATDSNSMAGAASYIGEALDS